MAYLKESICLFWLQSWNYLKITTIEIDEYLKYSTYMYVCMYVIFLQEKQTHLKWAGRDMSIKCNANTVNNFIQIVNFAFFILQHQRQSHS